MMRGGVHLTSFSYLTQSMAEGRPGSFIHYWINRLPLTNWQWKAVDFLDLLCLVWDCEVAANYTGVSNICTTQIMPCTVHWSLFLSLYFLFLPQGLHPGVRKNHLFWCFFLFTIIKHWDFPCFNLTELLHSIKYSCLIFVSFSSLLIIMRTGSLLFLSLTLHLGWGGGILFLADSLLAFKTCTTLL